MRLPDFLIIGAAKAGTTTLYDYLCQHPQIYMTSIKEPCFFSDNDIYAKGLDWYSSLFNQAASGQVCGEASTRYTRYRQYPEAATRIAQTLPNVKFIYIMRHPIERTYSHHVHEIRTGQNKPRTTFEEGIKYHSYMLDVSNYIQQIEQYLKIFPKDSFLFLLMEDLIQKPSDTLREIFKFLEVDETIDLVDRRSVAKNQARDHAEGFVRSKMTAPLKKIPAFSHAVGLLPQEWRDFAYQVLKALPYYGKWGKNQSYLPPPMLPETRQMLIEKFREPNQKLAELLNRDLSHWSK